jgi:hypothetical protein
MSEQRITYGMRFCTGATCSGHFINDVGASLEEAASWIVRHQLKKLPEDYRVVNVALWIDGKVVYERPSA